MTPKEKAKELVDKYRSFEKDGQRLIPLEFAKQCALIAVDEILKSFDGFMDSRKNFRHELEIDAERYWQKVKQEIKKL